MNSSIQKKLELLLAWEDRGYEAGNKKAQRSTEQLKKRAKELAVAMMAIGAAALAATAALFKFIKAGVQVMSVKDTFDGFRASADMSADTLDRINEITKETVSDMDLMNASVMALAGGLVPERLVELWGKAKQMADVMSKDTVEVFKGITDGMNKLEVETLKSIGITIRAEDVYKEYATSIGKSAAALTTKDRAIAFSMALEKKYVENFYKVGDVTTRNRELFQQLEKKLADTRDRFFELVASSPAVQGFLTMLAENVAEAGKNLDENKEKIEEFTESMIKLGTVILDVGKFTVQHKDDILALLSGIVATKVATWILGVASAMGVLQISAAAAGGWIGLVIGATVYLANNYKEVLVGFLEIWDTINRYFYGILAGFVTGIRMAAQVVGSLVPGMLDDAVDGMKKAEDYLLNETFGTTFVDGLQDKVMELPEFNIFELLFPTDKQDAERVLTNLSDFAAAAGDMQGMGLSEFAALGDKVPATEGGPSIESLWEKTPEVDNSFIENELAERQREAFEANEVLKQDIRLQLELEGAENIRGIHEETFFSEDERMWMQIDSERRAMDTRKQIHARAYGAMGGYSDTFFKKGANMGRVLNAMLIAGFSELAASYIESKTKQARFDALEYAYKAIAAAASGQWHLAAGFSQAAIGAGLVAGAGAIAAGYIRNLGQEKADAIMAEPDPFEETEDGTTKTTGQRKKATGVVNARPIHITINSTSSIQAGVAIFGDSEEAMKDVYETYTREQIQEDIESGMIAIPA